MNIKNKIECQECGIYRRTRHVQAYKGKYLCYKCMQKTSGLRDNLSVSELITRGKNLDEALAKTYTIEMIYVKGMNKGGRCYFPRVLVGKRFKLKLVK